MEDMQFEKVNSQLFGISEEDGIKSGLPLCAFKNDAQVSRTGQKKGLPILI